MYPNGAIRVENLELFRQAVRALEAGRPRLVREALNEAAQIVAAQAASDVPVRSGRLAKSIKAASTQREGRVRMGTPKRVPYAGWIEFGGGIPNAKNRGAKRPRLWREFVKEGRFLYPGYEKRQLEVAAEAMQALERAARRAGLY